MVEALDDTRRSSYRGNLCHSYVLKKIFLVFIFVTPSVCGWNYQVCGKSVVGSQVSK
ncbi:hypothetical protein ACSBR1_006807 [Camellia fascicularis]